MIRTDLAMEAKTLWEESAGETTKLRGVRARETAHNGIPVTTVEILDHHGEEALGKPAGRYITLELPRLERDVRRLAEILAEELAALLRLKPGQSVLIVGLGNDAVTPDAIGPQSVAGLFLTRHLIKHLPEQFGSCRPVSAVTPGVLATTGIESAEIVRGVVAHVKPDCVIAVDALAAASPERLCRTIQLSDTGIVPGSGVGNSRAALQERTLGVPVYCIGVPTVVDAATLTARSGERSGAEKTMIVTPRDIDAQIQFLSSVLSGGMNLALHPELEYEDFAQFVTRS